MKATIALPTRDSLEGHGGTKEEYMSGEGEKKETERGREGREMKEEEEKEGDEMETEGGSKTRGVASEDTERKARASCVAEEIRREGTR